MSARFYGLDLGTANCSVAYVADDPRQRDQLMIDVRTVAMRVDENDVATSARVPSIVSVDWRQGTGRNPLVGWEFHRAFGDRRRAPALLWWTRCNAPASRHATWTCWCCTAGDR
jgi:molecular chaperone DnaK (HSP70)